MALRSAYPTAARLLILFVLAASPAASFHRARAADDTPPTYSEVRELTRLVEEKRRRETEALENSIAAQDMDPDTAVQTRARIEREYRRDMGTVYEKQREVEKALDARMSKSSPSSSAPSRPTSNTGLPSLPPTSVKVYPGATEDAPAREGRQNNVGVGVRELEF